MRPASIWQLPSLRTLVTESHGHLRTVAINQCCFGAAWRKPTRLITSSLQVSTWGSQEWPSFDSNGTYMGPLASICSCPISTSLARKSNNEPFRTTGTDAYPPQMDLALAHAIADAFTSHICRPPTGGEKGRQKEGSSCVDKKEVHADSSRAVPRVESPREVPMSKGDEKLTGSSEVPNFRQGWGRPIRCYYKGRHRTIHDGGGLCSPGRWPVAERKPLGEGKAVSVAACFKKIFLKWVLNQDRSGLTVKDLFWKLAAGKFQSSPFDEWMPSFRNELDEFLKGQGMSPDKRSGDRRTEVHFRRLQEVIRLLQDEDCDWITELVEEGVPLGVDETMPRVEGVFELKTKWNLDFTDAEFHDVTADNYRSAEENAEDIERQVLQEVEAGFIIAKDMVEVAAEYKGRLAVAALGAVPKELGSSVVRIVHDGSYSVDVNHRIKVLDKLRFPVIDDAAGIILQLEEETRERGGVRMSLLYDVSHAHKLVPIKKRDWGLQAFRLPGGRQEGKVFLHTRGTFGIASAAYWWQRRYPQAGRAGAGCAPSALCG
eukprot:Skav214660  [mRNA]  locus=scaffold1706:68993:70624:- [translate_table: standard]